MATLCFNGKRKLKAPPKKNSAFWFVHEYSRNFNRKKHFILFLMGGFCFWWNCTVRYGHICPSHYFCTKTKNIYTRNTNQIATALSISIIPRIHKVINFANKNELHQRNRVISAFYPLLRKTCNAKNNYNNCCPTTHSTKISIIYVFVSLFEKCIIFVCMEYG